MTVMRKVSKRPAVSKDRKKTPKEIPVSKSLLIVDSGKPSKVKRSYWLRAFRSTSDYPKSTIRNGKWLIFALREQIDEIWEKVKATLEAGKLGNSAKVSTALPNPNSMDRRKHVICVYTCDGEDVADVRRIRESLREIGIVNKIPYKTDRATLEGKYQKSGSKRISLYYE